jgi:hypothetical protein
MNDYVAAIGMSVMGIFGGIVWLWILFKMGDDV